MIYAKLEEAGDKYLDDIEIHFFGTRSKIICELKEYKALKERIRDNFELRFMNGAEIAEESDYTTIMFTISKHDDELAGIPTGHVLEFLADLGFVPISETFFYKK